MRHELRQVNFNVSESVLFETIVSEKIFDCFAAGNVPIYWGASNVTDYIPEDCFIDMRSFSSFEELYQFFYLI